MGRRTNIRSIKYENIPKDCVVYVHVGKDATGKEVVYQLAKTRARVRWSGDQSLPSTEWPVENCLAVKGGKFYYPRLFRHFDGSLIVAGKTCVWHEIDNTFISGIEIFRTSIVLKIVVEKNLLLAAKLAAGAKVNNMPELEEIEKTDDLAELRRLAKRY